MHCTPGGVGVQVEIFQLSLRWVIGHPGGSPTEASQSLMVEAELQKRSSE
jgi:hypothetical protein